MSEQSPDEPSIAIAVADPGRRKAATDEARGANTNHEAPGERYPLSGGSRFRGSGHDIDIYALGTDKGPLVAEGKSRCPDGASLLRTASRTRHDPGHSRIVT